MRPVSRLLLIAVALVTAACEPSPDAERATTTFVECLERNGVIADDVSVTLTRDGRIEGIEATIIEEADVPYEPTVRLACTQEVEAGS